MTYGEVPKLAREDGTGRWCRRQVDDGAVREQGRTGPAAVESGRGARDGAAARAGPRQREGGEIALVTRQGEISARGARCDEAPVAWLEDEGGGFGIIAERRAKSLLRNGSPGAGSEAYQYLREAMDWFEKAEARRPAGNDDALLRWNACARIIMCNHLTPRVHEPVEVQSE